MQDLYANNQQLASHIGSLFKDLLSEGRAVKPQQASLESAGDCLILLGQQLLEYVVTQTIKYWLLTSYHATALCTSAACLAGTQQTAS